MMRWTAVRFAAAALAVNLMWAMPAGANESPRRCWERLSVFVNGLWGLEHESIVLSCDKDTEKKDKDKKDSKDSQLPACPYCPYELGSSAKETSSKQEKDGSKDKDARKGSADSKDECGKEDCDAKDDADPSGCDGKDKKEKDKKEKKKDPPKPFKNMFFENNFRFLDDPKNKYFDSLDFFKRIPLDHCYNFMTDVGGEFRWQGKVENNRRLNGINDDYSLFRERLYIDTWYKEDFRFYVEYIDAATTPQDEPPLRIDINRSDLLNIFGEARLWHQEHDKEKRSLSARYGRQELLYGAQRLVSPLDWANTRRNFDEMGKLFYRSPEWDIDGFWGRPITPDPYRFDHADQSRQFGGVYAVNKEIQDQTVDLYFLALLESDPIVTGRNGVMGDFEVYTFGARWFGSHCDWLWEVETAYQFGYQANQSRSAGMVTVGAGRRFPCWCGKPEIWFYYDWASGDADPGDGAYTTFNQLYPLGHKYFGILDIVGRQNIRDPNVIINWTLHPRIKLQAWFHHFFLDQPRDALYNAAGFPIRRDPTGRAGRDVGSEIDLILDVNVNPHADFQFGYGHFTPGRFIKETSVGKDADFFYAQFVFRF